MGVDRILLRNLSFRDIRLEQKFVGSKKSFQRLFLNIILVGNFFLSAVTWIMSPFGRSQFEIRTICAYLAHWLFVALVFYLGKRKTHLVDKLISFMLIYTIIAYSENNIQNRTYWNSLVYFLFGLMLEALVFTVVLARVSWQLSSVGVFISTTYAALRTTISATFPI